MHLPATPARPRDRSLVARLANAKTTSVQSPSQAETACATFSSSTTCRRRNPLTIDYLPTLDDIPLDGARAAPSLQRRPAPGQLEDVEAGHRPRQRKRRIQVLSASTAVLQHRIQRRGRQRQRAACPSPKYQNIRDSKVENNPFFLPRT